MTFVSKAALHRLAGLTAALLCLGTTCAMTPATADPVPIQPAAPIPVPPELDPAFYRPDAGLVAAKEPGQIISARQVNLANLGVIPLNVDAWQVSYRSNNSRDEAIAAVATVMKPRGSAPSKLVSMQIAEDSLAGYCSPSYTVQQWSPAILAGQIVAPAEFMIAQAAVQQGWAVVMPDHQGPDSAYAAGPLAGRITLDGIRAAQRFEPLNLASDTRTGMYGYSGGAIATGHAAELAHSYAPELNIVGTAEGGVPADLGAVLSNGNNGAWAGIIFAAVLGLAREYPDFAELLNRDLNPLGKGLATIKSGLCVQYNTALLPFLNISGLLQVSGGDPLQHPVVRATIDRTLMGKAVPDMPMYIWNGNPDELIPVGPVNTLVDTYCQSPTATVQYTREHLSEHITTEISGAAPALLWLKARLEDVPAQPGCSTTDAGWLALNPDGMALFASIFGETIASFFGKPIGTN